MDLERLMQSLKNGDIQALAKIYELTKNSVYASVFSILRSDNMVEDVMQETYIKVYKNINSYKPQGRPKAWICRIAKNIALDNCRKFNRTVPIEDYENILKSPDSFRNDDRDTYNDIIDIAEKVLNDTELQIVLMYTVGDLSHSEIAKVLDKPHATVRWIYHSSIKKIRKYIIDNKVEL